MKRASFGNSDDGVSDSDSDSGSSSSSSSSSSQGICEPIIIGARDRATSCRLSTEHAEGSGSGACAVPVSDLLKGGGQLLQRLQALLPQLQQSKQELDAKVAAGADVDIENVCEESGRIIQMDLRFALFICPITSTLFRATILARRTRSPLDAPRQPWSCHPARRVGPPPSI